jgi:hypothetical protein
MHVNTFLQFVGTLICGHVRKKRAVNIIDRPFRFSF